jgi:hypothetical protein
VADNKEEQVQNLQISIDLMPSVLKKVLTWGEAGAYFQ